MRGVVPDLRAWGVALATVGWALGLGGCTRSLDRPTGSAFDWTAVRTLPAYDFTADSAKLGPAASAGEYVLVREVIGADTWQGSRGDHEQLLIVPLDADETLGFVALDRYRGLAVAGDVEHPIRTTHGVRFTWCRRSSHAEKVHTTALDVVRGGALFTAALSVAYLIDKWGIDDDDEESARY